MSMRRRDLFGALNSPSLAAEEEYGAHGFGYAGASHEPQGRVLTAEELYGALNSPSLAAEEEYGALGSESLLAEEEYGVDDDDDFGAWYGSDDDDDDDDDDEDEDDDFGAWYGADDDEFGDDDDDALADLEAQVDQDLYGAWYGATGALDLAPEAEGFVPQMANALAPGALLPNQLRGGYIESFIEGADAAMAPEAAEEIARRVMQHPEFVNWSSHDQASKARIVQDALRSSTAGVDMQVDDNIKAQFQQALSDGASFLSEPSLGAAWGLIKQGPYNLVQNLHTWATIDVPNISQAALIQLPIAGNLTAETMKALGAKPDDALINTLAMRYQLASQVFGPQVYDWIANSIDMQADAGSAASAVAASQFSEQPMDMGPALVGPVAPIPSVQAPSQVIAPSTSGLPRPQTILAFGYAAMCGGAALGIFD